MSATATNASIGIQYTHSKSELCTARTTLCTRICLRMSPWSENDLVYLDLVYRDLTLSVGTQRAMPEAQLILTKGIGAESNQQYKHSNEVLEPKPKYGNVHMM